MVLCLRSKVVTERVSQLEELDKAGSGSAWHDGGVQLLRSTYSALYNYIPPQHLGPGSGISCLRYVCCAKGDSPQ
jgi:hypothetical protein